MSPQDRIDYLHARAESTIIRPARPQWLRLGPHTIGEQLRRQRRRNRALLLLLALFAFSACAGALYTWYAQTRPEPAPAPTSRSYEPVREGGSIRFNW